MATGFLQVQVGRGSRFAPVEAVSVAVYAEEALVTVLQTDATGRTVVQEITTPPLGNSQSAEAGKPFRSVRLQLDLDGVPGLTIDNVQVYPDELALQRVLFSMEDTLIPDPVLWGDYPPKIPEPDIKRLPGADGFVVLERPVIPEFMVVHEGVPTDGSAETYWLSFKEYVKNVASSEIYATWPTEALKANILAIQSFALNRVYTEWYRGKGYDFTITNSTAFDQAFSYGRTIYESISQVVDELFTTYISKADITQPLLAQFSDGREVVREGWLSQWGSKELADDGFSALEILRYYYGQDIVLKQAEKVQGVPSSYPGETLQEGSRGNAVSTVQRQLNAIAEKFPLIPKVAVDGIYGAKTAASVRVFQEVFGLPATGVVDFATWYELSQIFVAVERLAELG